MIIGIEDDFSLEKMADCGQCFRAVCLSDGSYRFISRDKVLNIREQGSHQFQVSCSEEEWDEFWRDYFDLSRTYKRIREDLLLQICPEHTSGSGRTFFCSSAEKGRPLSDRHPAGCQSEMPPQKQPAGRAA